MDSMGVLLALLQETKEKEAMIYLEYLSLTINTINFNTILPQMVGLVSTEKKSSEIRTFLVTLQTIGQTQCLSKPKIMERKENILGSRKT